MPEIKNNFLQGKMNQDLDERLIPNGQYRDALNIEVSTSEEAGAGTAQNILGNTLSSGDILIYDHCECIGSIADEKNNKLYWFVHCNDRDAIIEYDELLNRSQTILCDMFYLAGATDGSNPPLEQFLKFSNKKITGINIIDDFLFWTDGNNEPKKVNIRKAKEKQKTLGTGNGQTINHHSRYWGLDSSPFIREEHLTVIKKKPLLAPKVKINFSSVTKTASNRIFERAFVRFCTRYKYADGEYSAYSPFTQVVFNPIYKSGLNNFNYFSTEESYNTSMTNVIESVDLYGLINSDANEDVVQVDILAKIENSPNVYSIKSIKRTDAEWEQGKEFFQESLGSIAAEEDQIFSKGKFTVKSESIHAIIPNSQNLRPWDNVPKKALAQEVTGNRIVYGNYTQGYSLKDVFNNDINIDLIVDVEKREEEFTSYVKKGRGKKTIKSQRDYKLGVVYADEYGRETPVLTSDSASLKLNWNQYIEGNDSLLGSTSTMFNVQLGSNIPYWADSYKFYVKQTSGEYYNMVMLRAYLPGSYDLWDNIDRHVWISFSSSDRNKISEETYLVIKKVLDPGNYEQIPIENKYKVLDIANEAPDAIKFNYYNLGKLSNSNGVLDGNESELNVFPDEDYRLDKIINDTGVDQIHIGATAWNGSSGSPLFSSNSDDQTIVEPDNLYISWRGVVGSDLQNSLRYKIISVSKEEDNYHLKLATKKSSIDANIAAHPTDSSFLNTTLIFQVERKEENDGEDFSGKFFVKIQQESTAALSGSLGGAIGNKGEEDDLQTGNEQEVFLAALQSVYYFANANANQYEDHTTGIVGATSDGIIPDDNPSGVTGHNADNNVSLTADDWDALLASQNSGNGIFFIDRTNFAAAAFGNTFYARETGQPFGYGVGNTVQGGHSSTINRDFVWDPSQDARVSVATGDYGIASYNGDAIDIYEDDAFGGISLYEDTITFQALAHRYIVSNIEVEDVNTIYDYEDAFGEFDYDAFGANTISVLGSVIPFIEKSYGWATVYRGTLPNSYWWKNQQEVDGPINQVSGLEGIIESGTEHTEGKHRWKSTKNYGFDNVYEENGKFYMYLSFLGPGVDLHDGTGLQEALEDNAELNGNNGIGKYMQGIWGGGVFTNSSRGTYDPNYELRFDVEINAYDVPWGDNFVDNMQNQDNDYGYEKYSINQNVLYKTRSIFPTEFGDPVELSTFGTSNPSAQRRRKMHVEFEGNYDSDNEPLQATPDPNFVSEDTLVGYDFDYADRHYNQWNPAYGHPNEAEINSFLFYLNQPDAQFRFANDTTDTVYTIQSVTKKRLYNHTPWRRRYRNDMTDFVPAGDSVEEAVINWADTCGSGVVPDGDGGTATALKNKILDFGSRSNRRVVYILELDQNPLASTDYNPLTNIDVDTASNIEFLSANQAQVLNTQIATFPAIIETEPKPSGDLELYYEASDSIPIRIKNKKQGEVFAPVGCKVEFPNIPNAYGGGDDGNNVRLKRWLDDGVFEVGVKDVENSGFNWFNPFGAGEIDYSNEEVKFIREDGSYTTGVISLDYNTFIYVDDDGDLNEEGETASNIDTDFYPNGVRAKFKINVDVSNKIGLNWYNSFTFEDGVESNRIRDDFNAMQITNGAKVSTVIEEPYAEEHRKNGLIYSGVYNSNSGVNNLNQFIAAEKITKDINPTYGSIQKLYSRNTDLVALCEDRIIKILANKDALFNAD